MKSSVAGSGASLGAGNPTEGEKKNINPELWQACAGPLANLPAAGTHVVYFPQGHSEQVAASMKKDVDAQIPNYPNLPSKLLCLLHNVTLHADPETDEVYAQMTLLPVPSFDKDALLRSDLSMKANRPQTEFFCKTLTASDTSTHGGFSVPRRAAEKIFPPLDFSMQPPAQELVARDLHDNVWTFRHIYRGQPKRHLLTTGWSLFVSGKRLFAGDSVLFIRDEKQQLLLGIRRANRQPTNLSSSVLSSDSMHIGILAAAAHAAANNSPFTVFYNPRASPSEFVIPLAKYYKAVCSNQISLGMRFRMMFETEESGTRRYMGTVTGISDLDPVRWKNSQWRNLQVGWDESTAGERRNRVSVWEIEPVTAPFFICPTPPFYRSKRPRQPGMPDDETSDLDNLLKRTMPWLGDDICMKDPHSSPGLSLVQWMNMQQNPSLANSIQPNNYMTSFSNSVLQNLSGTDSSRQIGFAQPQIPVQTNFQFNTQRPTQLENFQKLPPSALNSLASMMQNDLGQLPMRQNLTGQTLPPNQAQAQHNFVQSQNNIDQQSSIQNHQLQRNLSQNNLQQQQMLSQAQQKNMMPSQPINQQASQLQMLDNQVQLQYLQKLHQHQQQSLMPQQSALQQTSQLAQLHDQQKPQVDISPIFSRSMSTSQMVEVPQTTSTSLPQPQMTRNNNNQTNVQFSHLSTQPKLLQQPGKVKELSRHVSPTPTPAANQLSTAGSGSVTGAAGGGQSGVTDDIPSCSTSPSSNNCPNGVPPAMNNVKMHTTQAPTLSSPSGLENVTANINFAKDFHQKAEVKPSVNISKGQNQGFLTSQGYLNVSGTQMDFLDSSSSGTSVCHSQSDVHQHQNLNPLSYNSQTMMFRDAIQEGEFHDDPGTSIPFATDIDNHMGMPMISDPLITKGLMGSSRKDFSNNLSPGGMISGFDNSKDAQPELSSSMVSQSFGIPDMFNSIDSTINESSLLNTGVWAQQPQFPRIRTYTKVYKRGAVGRSIDVTAYSGYEELKHDLARRFGIEGQLEDRQRIGWKLVYVDHENDVLLVGDDPWEEFVNCVRCIKILSPQEVQQMSLDGDFENNVLPNQACSSSDGGNT